MVPSIRAEEELTARELDRRFNGLQRGFATPSELGSGTFTLNNYGVFCVDGSGGDHESPGSRHPWGRRIIDKPWVVNGELAVRKVAELTLTFDHRGCDRGTACGLLLVHCGPRNSAG